LATITVTHPHSIGIDQAFEITDRIATHYKNRNEVEYFWEGFCLKFTRTGAHGEIHVGENEIRIAVTLSMLLRPLKGRIEREIQKELNENLR
jgi:putative polyhydroxyalkanoate system protein